jgi:Na+/H+ antiporter NhaA
VPSPASFSGCSRRCGREHAAGERFEHRLHPVSAGFAVPVFALAATGIPLAAAGDALDDRIAVAVFAGLLLGNVVGMFDASRSTISAPKSAPPPACSPPRSWRP